MRMLQQTLLAAYEVGSICRRFVILPLGGPLKSTPARSTRQTQSKVLSITIKRLVDRSFIVNTSVLLCNNIGSMSLYPRGTEKIILRVISI
jgi:hypothetical protein